MDGLFGNTRQQASNYAQTGATFGRAVGRLFGLKDPILERRTILSETDYTDPASIRAAAQKLITQGDIDAGIQLASQARQIEEKERAFGLQERQLTATEKRIENEQLNQAQRLALDKETLELRKKEIEQRADLNALEKKRINAQIDSLQKADYYITEQKGEGGITAGFIAINKRDAKDRVEIPLTSSKEEIPAGAAGAAGATGATATGPKPSLDTFFTGSTGVSP